MPRPPESATIDGSGIGTIWVTSSRASSSGGSSRWPSIEPGHLLGGELDLGDQAAEQRRDRGVLASLLTDQVQRAGLHEEALDVELVARARGHALGELRVGHERHRGREHQPDRGGGPLGLAAAHLLQHRGPGDVPGLA